MRAPVLQQDYWPGFLDILVNVMLYMLLLVGSFALGAVALTLHSMQQRQQLSFLDSDKASVMQAMGLDEADRGRLMQRLESLDVQAMVNRREALDRGRQLAENMQRDMQQRDMQQRDRQRELALRQAQAQRASPAQSTQPTQSSHEQALVQIKQQYLDSEMRLAVLTDQLRSAQSGLTQAKQALAASAQAGRSEVTPRVSDFRVGGPARAATGERSLAFLLAEQLGREPSAVWEFAADELLWPQAKVAPISGMSLSDQMPWLLLIFADTANPRIVRESFARVNSVRQTLIDRGFEKERIKVEVRPHEASKGLDERLYRSVFMLPNN